MLASRRVVVEVRGCFWHGHKACQRGRVPKTRSAFWTEKIAANRARDARNAKALRALGWKVVVAWECRVNRGGPSDVVGAVRAALPIHGRWAPRTNTTAHAPR